MAAFVILHVNAHADVRAVWAVNDGEKVDRDDLGNSHKLSNSSWDGQKILLFAARNEIVAFQLIVESDAAGIESLAVTLPELKHSEGKARIAYAPPAKDPTLYVGRPIQIFSEHYLQVTSPTQAGWIYKLGTPSAPRNPTGWKPVQLVPENARKGRGGFPLQVGPSRNQGIWMEIYIARDLPAGVYRGTVQLQAGDQKRHVPLELEIFDFTLPDRNVVNAMVFYEDDQPVIYQGRNLDETYHRFAHRQRIELVAAASAAKVKTALGRYHGDDFTKGVGYEGPGEYVGNLIVPASFYGPGSGFDERESAWKQSDDWMTFLRNTLPGALTFLYMPDEPRSAEFPRVRKLADNIHSNPGPGRKLPVFVTHSYTEELAGAMDIWCSGPEGYFIQRAIQERAAGRDYWVYNGGRPAGGAVVIDAPATDARANIWGCFKHDIKVYFYWHGLHWRHNHQKPGNRIQNVWVDPVTFDNRGQPNKPIGDQSFANGDGVLMYPGEEILHPEEDRGIAGPCSTIQLANLRRGLQDSLYLSLARQCKLDDAVTKALQSVVPRMFSDAGPTVGFAEDGDTYENARRELAEAIALARKK